MKRTRRFWILATGALVAAAVVEELRKPREERTWHGRIAGLIPYDFRPPSLKRFKDSVWAPDDERIFTDRVFGVGWTINLGRVARLAGLA